MGRVFAVRPYILLKARISHVFETAWALFELWYSFSTIRKLPSGFSSVKWVLAGWQESSELICVKDLTQSACWTETTEHLIISCPCWAEPFSQNCELLSVLEIQCFGWSPILGMRSKIFSRWELEWCLFKDKQKGEVPASSSIVRELSKTMSEELDTDPSPLFLWVCCVAYPPVLPSWNLQSWNRWLQPCIRLCQP